MSSSESARTEVPLTERVDELVREMQEILASGETDRISAQSVRQMLTVAVKLYVAKREAGEGFLPVDESITATEVSVTAHGMLKAADMQVFELSLWSGFGAG